MSIAQSDEPKVKRKRQAKPSQKTENVFHHKDSTIGTAFESMRSSRQRIQPLQRHFVRMSCPGFHSELYLLSGRDRYDRRALLAFGFGQREEKHDKRKKPLGNKIFVIDPIPFLTVRYGGKGIAGTFACA